MNYLEKLKELLNRYIEENKVLKETYSKNLVLKDLYEELLACLNYDKLKDNRLLIPLLFKEIYNNDIYLNSFYNILVCFNDEEVATSKLEKLYSDINDDYMRLLTEIDSLKLRIDRSKNIVSSAHRVLLCFKHHLPVNQDKYDIFNIKRIISYFEISGVILNKEEILLINEIESYNRRVGINSKDYIEKNYVYGIYNEIPNILNAGFQPHDEIEISANRKETIEKFIREITEYIQYLNGDDIIQAVSSYHDYNLDNNEYNYIIISLLNNYIDELYTYYELLVDKDIYMIRKNRNEIIKEYYRILDRYLILLSYYDKINKNIDNRHNDDDLEDNDNKKVLLYAHSNVNVTKSRLFGDMKSMPYEYYMGVYELLTNYKNNTSSKKEIKKIEVFNCIELRDDQIRIILKHLRDDIYVIMGVFAKKDDNNRPMYKAMVSRQLPDISNDDKLNNEIKLAEIYDDELFKLINDKSRKGSR